jgi:hypothetical protein
MIPQQDQPQAAMPALSKCPPGSLVSAFELTLPASLPKATIEPVKVTAPMNTPSNSSTAQDRQLHRRLVRDGAAKPVSAFAVPRHAADARHLDIGVEADEAPPQDRPSECIAATSCGISVICTFLATYQPMTPPKGDQEQRQSHRPSPGR